MSSSQSETEEKDGSHHQDEEEEEGRDILFEDSSEDEQECLRRLMQAVSGGKRRRRGRPSGTEQQKQEQQQEGQPLKKRRRGRPRKSDADRPATAVTLLPPSPPQSKTTADSSSHLEGCSCKKTRCLKLYCQCFSLSKWCHTASTSNNDGAAENQFSCRCTDCHNTPEYSDDVQEARNSILQRNPSRLRPIAFEDLRSPASVPSATDNNNLVPALDEEKDNRLERCRSRPSSTRQSYPSVTSLLPTLSGLALQRTATRISQERDELVKQRDGLQKDYDELVTLLDDRESKYDSLQQRYDSLLEERNGMVHQLNEKDSAIEYLEKVAGVQHGLALSTARTQRRKLQHQQQKQADKRNSNSIGTVSIPPKFDGDDRDRDAANVKTVGGDNNNDESATHLREGETLASHQQQQEQQHSAGPGLVQLPVMPTVITPNLESDIIFGVGPDTYQQSNTSSCVKFRELIEQESSMWKQANEISQPFDFRESIRRIRASLPDAIRFFKKQVKIVPDPVDGRRRIRRIVYGEIDSDYNLEDEIKIVFKKGIAPTFRLKRRNGTAAAVAAIVAVMRDRTTNYINDNDKHININNNHPIEAGTGKGESDSKSIEQPRNRRGHNELLSSDHPFVANNPPKTVEKTIITKDGPTNSNDNSSSKNIDGSDLSSKTIAAAATTAVTTTTPEIVVKEVAVSQNTKNLLEIGCFQQQEHAVIPHHKELVEEQQLRPPTNVDDFLSEEERENVNSPTTRNCSVDDYQEDDDEEEEEKDYDGQQGQVSRQDDDGQKYHLAFGLMSHPSRSAKSATIAVASSNHDEMFEHDIVLGRNTPHSWHNRSNATNALFRQLLEDEVTLMMNCLKNNQQMFIVNQAINRIRSKLPKEHRFVERVIKDGKCAVEEIPFKKCQKKLRFLVKTGCKERQQKEKQHQIQTETEAIQGVEGGGDGDATNLDLLQHLDGHDNLDNAPTAALGEASTMVLPKTSDIVLGRAGVETYHHSNHENSLFFKRLCQEEIEKQTEAWEKSENYDRTEGIRRIVEAIQPTGATFYRLILKADNSCWYAELSGAVLEKRLRLLLKKAFEKARRVAESIPIRPSSVAVQGGKDTGDPNDKLGAFSKKRKITQKVAGVTPRESDIVFGFGLNTYRTSGHVNSKLFRDLIDSESQIRAEHVRNKIVFPNSDSISNLLVRMPQDIKWYRQVKSGSVGEKSYIELSGKDLFVMILRVLHNTAQRMQSQETKEEQEETHGEMQEQSQQQFPDQSLHHPVVLEMEEV